MINSSIFAAFERMWQHITARLANKADANHNHEGLYITEAEVNDKLAGKADADHNHNDLYYTESEIDGLLSNKSDSTHKHDNDYDVKGAATQALNDAKAYADGVKNDLLNGAGAAYDTLKELGDLIDDNTDAIEALDRVASGKADATHEHTVSDITDLTTTVSELNYVKGVTSSIQSQLDEKANKEHSHDNATTSASGFMTAEMVMKLNDIENGANKTIVDSALSDTSTNPVQNMVVNNAVVSLVNAISANTDSIDAHTTAIDNLRADVDAIVAITSDEIKALFK